MIIKAVQYGLGISLIILGIAGLFLPFLQGVLMILIGVVVLRAHNVGDAWTTIKEKANIVKRKK